jgi:hypothetical protein
MAAKSYRLKIVTGANEFEAEGDKAFVLDMLKRFGPGSAAASQEVTKTPQGKTGDKKRLVTAPSSGKAVSIREFIQQFELKKQTDITLAFGYYLEKHTGVPEFTAADINNCYYDAKMESSNTSQMIVQNIKRGHMMPSKKKGEKGTLRYTLTSSGEKFVETKLPRST